MNHCLVNFVVLVTVISFVSCQQCQFHCPVEDTEMECGFDIREKTYRMFSSKCAMTAYAECHKAELIQTPLKYCIKNQKSETRKVYGESCPVFCPNHYRPVCAASKLRDYAYRTFNNGCYLDMVNCRGDEDFGYIEVPLEFCQRHHMKNIFKEQVVVTDLRDHRDYDY